MRFISTSLLFISGITAFAQSIGNSIPLYYSQQSSKSSFYTGSFHQKTEQKEHGSIQLSVNGPIKYKVTPPDLTINPNEEKTWTGTIQVDSLTHISAGISMKATLTTAYDLWVMQPKAKDSTQKEIVNLKGTRSSDFTVYSLDIKSPDSISMCSNNIQQLYAIGYPDGGSYKWEVTGKLVPLVNDDGSSVEVKAKGQGNSVVKVTYSIGGVSVSKNIYVSIIEPTVTSLPETLLLDSGIVKSFTLFNSKRNPEFDSVFISKKDNWCTAEIKNDLLLISLQSNKASVSDIKVFRKMCNASFENTISIVAKGFKPASISGESLICKGQQALYKYQMSSTKAKFQWQVSGHLSIVGSTSHDSVMIKSTESGSGILSLSYTINNVTEKIEKHISIPPDSFNISFNSPTNSISNDTVWAIYDDITKINCLGIPEGLSPKWTCSQNIKMIQEFRASSNLQIIMESGSGWIEIAVDHCGTQFTKRLPVMNNSLFLKLPAVVYVRKNHTISVTAATGRSDGSFIWTASGNISVPSGNTTKTATVRGVLQGKGMLKASYSVEGKILSESVDVIVTDSLIESRLSGIESFH